MKHSKNEWMLFFIGMFSATQVRLVGSIGISEIPIYFVAPFLFMVGYSKIKKDGFAPAVWLSLLACLSCVLSSIYNHTPIPLFLRGFATCYSIFAAIVVFHRLLRGNIMAFRWFLLGFAISMIINVYVFQQSVETYTIDAGGSNAEKTEMIMNRELFWLSRVGPWLTLPVCGWYFESPIWFSIVASLVMPIYTMIYTATGRSALIISLAGVTLIALGRKDVQSMHRIQKHIFVMMLILLVIASIFKGVYKHLGQRGMLNEKAQTKYEKQASMKDQGLIGLLVSGRVDFFMGLMAATRRPIWGYGPWAEDRDGIAGEFLSKYGSHEDVIEFYKNLDYKLQQKGTYGLVPAHSYIIGFWVYYGFFAMWIWIYVCWLIYKLVRYNLCVVPRLFGYFSLCVFSSLWAILFSPYAARLSMPLFIVMMLFVDAIRRGRISDECLFTKRT